MSDMKAAISAVHANWKGALNEAQVEALFRDFLSELEKTHAVVHRDTSVAMRIAGHVAIDNAYPGLGAQFGWGVMQDVWTAMLKAAEPPPTGEK
jgi:hypothetical protein